MRFWASALLFAVIWTAAAEARGGEACSPPSGLAEGGSGWQQISPGLEVRDIRIRYASEPPVRMVGVRVSPGGFRVALHWEAAGSPPSSTAEDIARRTGAAVVLNAGYFDETGRPMGFFLAGGKIYNSRIVHRGRPGALHLGAVFYLHKESGRVGIVPRDDFLLRKAGSAFQAGPLLVRNGRPVAGLSSYREFRRPARRTVFAIGRRGRLLILVSEEVGRGISWCELREFLSMPEEKGGLGVREAMNLDGGSSSQLYVQSGSYRRHLPGRPVPALIAIVGRSPSANR